MQKYVHVSSDTVNECELGVALQNMADNLRASGLSYRIEGKEATRREVGKWLAEGSILFHKAHAKGVGPLSERFPRATFYCQELPSGKSAGQFPFAIGDGLLLITKRDAERRPPKEGQDKRYVYFIFVIETANESSEAEDSTEQQSVPEQAYRARAAS